MATEFARLFIFLNDANISWIMHGFVSKNIHDIGSNAFQLQMIT